MANRFPVPIKVIAPEDPSDRQNGESAERMVREQIGAIYADCDVPPQPRWLFQDIAAGKPMSMAQLFRALSLLAQCPDIQSVRIEAAAEEFCAMTKGFCAQYEDESLVALHVAETEAQGAADVLQLHATLSGGKDRAAVQRALHAVTNHVVAAKAVQTHLASTLGRSFVRTPSRVAASRMR